jgi:hypothetical protein
MKGETMRRFFAPSMVAATLALVGMAGAEDLTGTASNGAPAIQPHVPITAPTANTVLSAVGQSGAVAGDIENLPEIGSITIVDISEVSGGGDRESIEAAVAANAEAVDELRSTMESEDRIAAALQAQGVATAEVVAADVDAAGNVTVFTQRMS